MSVNPQNLAEGALEVRAYFVRGRNALVARAQLSELFVEYYLHLASLGKQQNVVADTLFKEILAAFVLHCASRPRNESIAWTINFQEPLVDIFLTGDNALGTVVGRALSENVRRTGKGMFFSDVSVRGGMPYRSAVSVECGSAFSAVERYYTQSEQRRGRFFEILEEDFVFISAQPDCDFAWLESLDTEAMRSLDRKEQLSLLETRWVRWECGCNQSRLLGVLAPAARNAIDGFFGAEPSVRTECPRCGTHYVITREAMEAFLRS